MKKLCDDKAIKCNLTCLPDVTKYVDDILRVSIMGIYERKDFDEIDYVFIQSFPSNCRQ